MCDGWESQNFGRAVLREGKTTGRSERLATGAAVTWSEGSYIVDIDKADLNILNNGEL